MGQYLERGSTIVPHVHGEKKKEKNRDASCKEFKTAKNHPPDDDACVVHGLVYVHHWRAARHFNLQPAPTPTVGTLYQPRRPQRVAVSSQQGGAEMEAIRQR